MRRLSLGLMPLLVVTIGCGRFNPFPADIVFKYDNRTEATLCSESSASAAEDGRCLAELKQHSTTTWRRGCSSRGKESIVEIITVRDTGQWIYEGTASCKGWKDTNQRFVIARTPQEFVVIDPLGRVTITPIQ
jgi:hypothetical protein